MPIPTDTDTVIRERFLALPKVVQDAITSADIEQKLRGLSDTNKLHLDQWEIFENEVMLALLGFQKAEDLEDNIVSHVGVSSDVARNLAENVSLNIFEPIREKLEQELEHPSATPAGAVSADTMRDEVLAAARAEEAATAIPTAPAIQPATPPAPVPDIKVTRPSESTEYKPGQASHERKSIVDDPYREPPV